MVKDAQTVNTRMNKEVNVLQDKVKLLRHGLLWHCLLCGGNVALRE